MSAFFLLGDPVGHSLSPRMHGAAFRALGVDHTYAAVRVGPADLAGWVGRLRRGEVGGLNVTVPHKKLAMELADAVDETALACDAANVLALRDGVVMALNTDRGALEDELARPGDGLGVVLGNGGAARAAVAALRRVGATKVVVRARRGGDEPLAASGTEAGARWVVQATSAGMAGVGDGDVVARAVDFALVRPDATVIDVVYEPRETPFLAAARRAGLPAANGIGMLVRQGARALGEWLRRDLPPPVVAAMHEAVA